MIMAVGLTVSKIGRGQMSQGSGHNQVDYNSLLNIQFSVYKCIFSKTLGHSTKWLDVSDDPDKDQAPGIFFTEFTK